MTHRPRAAVILAAGHGSRMASALAKPLHAVGGRPMLDWSLALAEACGVERSVVVWGAHGPQVRERAEAAGASTALQDPPRGTGDAVKCARDALSGFEGDVIVLYADTPLIRPETVQAVFAALETGAAVSVLGFEPDEPGAYGRLIETEDGDLDAIVEAGEARPDELAVRLCNSGVLAADAALLFELLGEVTNDNAKGEYYLTDVVGLARRRGLSAKAVRADEAEVLGVNARADLAAAEAAFQTRARANAMAAGVTLIAPETVFFSHDTVLAPDVTVEPHVVFAPGAVLKARTRIAAFTRLGDAADTPGLGTGGAGDQVDG